MSTPWSLLLDMARGARDACIAAPYMKEAPLRKLLVVLADDAVVTCITRWQRNDIVLGASDLTCREIVLDNGGLFLLHPRLHAKFYRFESQILVGSANLTTRGMGYAPPVNTEVLCEPGPGFDGQAFEVALLEAAHPIDETDVARWKAIERLPPQGGASTPEPNEWKPVTRDPEHVWLAYTGEAEQVISPDEREMALRDLAQLGLTEGLDRAAFDGRMVAALLSSAAISDVRRTEQMPDSEAWTRLAQAWGTTKGDAQRCRETAQSWLVTFLDEGSAGGGG